MPEERTDMLDTAHSPHYNALKPLLGREFILGRSGSMQECRDWSDGYVAHYCADYDFASLVSGTDDCVGYLCPEEIDDGGYEPWIIINDK